MENLWRDWRMEYIESADKEDGCVFCELPTKEPEEALVLKQTPLSFALMNLYPYNPGHVMVAPKRHTASFEALEAEARFDHVLFEGSAFGHEGEVHVGSEEEMDFLGIPGLLEPDQVREVLRHKQAERSRRTPPGARAEESGRAVPATTHERMGVLRRELNGLVAAWHHRTGESHGAVHAALRRESR